MNKAEKKFVLFAVLAVFVSVTLLLAVINIVTFTMAARDADRITEEISKNKGRFPGGAPFDLGSFGPMGPSSPEMNESLRDFTVTFDSDGKGKVTAYHISAVTEEEAVSWAESLKNESTGWTKGSYRYRVYRDGKKTVVIVIDQGREMISCYRILLISLIGDFVMVLISFIVLSLIGRKLFAPLEEADRNEKRFREQVKQDFKVPLTVISANTELIDRQHGSSDETAAIRNEVKRMNGLIGGLGAGTVFEAEEKRANLSEIAEEKAKEALSAFEAAGKTLETKIEDGITAPVDGNSFGEIVMELLKNMREYAKTGGTLILKKEGERITLQTDNDTDLPDGPADHAFDRNTVLENGTGLGAGLANVKDAVKAANGRARAEVREQRFIVTISL